MNIQFICISLASVLLAGCLFNEGTRNTCGDEGVVQKGESNWVFLVDSTLGYRIITRYPIDVSAKVFDSYLQPLNEFAFSIDSQQFAKLPVHEGKFRSLGVSWDFKKKDGSYFEGGCYKVQFEITAPTVNLLPDDLPASNKTGVLLEINKAVYPIEK